MRIGVYVHARTLWATIAVHAALKFGQSVLGIPVSGQRIQTGVVQVRPRDQVALLGGVPASSRPVIVAAVVDSRLRCGRRAGPCARTLVVVARHTAVAEGRGSGPVGIDPTRPGWVRLAVRGRDRRTLDLVDAIRLIAGGSRTRRLLGHQARPRRRGVGTCGDVSSRQWRQRPTVSDSAGASCHPEQSSSVPGIMENTNLLVRPRASNSPFTGRRATSGSTGGRNTHTERLTSWLDATHTYAVAGGTTPSHHRHFQRLPIQWRRRQVEAPRCEQVGTPMAPGSGGNFFNGAENMTITGNGCAGPQLTRRRCQAGAFSGRQGPHRRHFELEHQHSHRLSYAFDDASKFNDDLSWDPGRVTHAGRTFKARWLSTVTSDSWNTGNVQYMNECFYPRTHSTATSGTGMSGRSSRLNMFTWRTPSTGHRTVADGQPAEHEPDVHHGVYVQDISAGHTPTSPT